MVVFSTSGSDWDGGGVLLQELSRVSLFVSNNDPQLSCRPQICLGEGQPERELEKHPVIVIVGSTISKEEITILDR
jgi:hypothetical protein